MDKKKEHALDTVVADLRDSMGDRLVSVILHGAEARGDHFEAARDLYLLIVLKDLEPKTLRRLGEPIAKWLRKGHPMPRLFTARTIDESADAFPIELLDISRHKRVLFGSDPFGAIEVDEQHLRLQCERELREKLMRTQEAFVESRGRKSRLKELLIESYLAFVEVFRGCLRLSASEVPSRSADIVSQWCERAGLEAEPFRAVEALAHGDSPSEGLEEVFAAYYQQLRKAVDFVDQFKGQST